MADHLPIPNSRSRARPVIGAPSSNSGESTVSVRGSGRVTLSAASQLAAVQRRFFLVGRLLGPESRFPGFKGTIPTIWRLRHGLAVHDAGERFLFHFDRVADRDRILSGGPWHYRNTMLVLNSYDGLHPVEEIPLFEVTTWVAIRGLPVELRHKEALSCIGSSLGQIVHFDQQALFRRDEEQRIKLRFDVRDRVRSWMQFEVSPSVKPELHIIFEKVKGFCRACGLFVHDASGCDEYLNLEMNDLLNGDDGLNFEGLNIDPIVPVVDVRDPSSPVRNVSAGIFSDMNMEVSSVPSESIATDEGSDRMLEPQGAVLNLLSNSVSLECGRFSSVAPPLVNHLKRLAVTDLPRPWKKHIISRSVSVDDSMAIVVEHKNGKLLVSPKKKQGRGRPKGSTNRPKVAEELDLDKVVVVKKRQYKAKKPDPNLMHPPSGSVASVVPVLESDVPIENGVASAVQSVVLVENAAEVDISTSAEKN